MIKNFLNEPMAIPADRLRQLIQIARLNTDLAAADRKTDDQPFSYDVVNKKAIISINGILTKNKSLFSYLFGGTSMRDVGQAFQAAMDDSGVNAIILAVDSPGGTVDGTHELASQIMQARGKKPIVTIADGSMLSAAYWIGSAADQVYISNPTTEIGSVGVVATHVDVSKQDEMRGEKFTEISAGRYKRISSAHRPLSEEGQGYLQERVDNIYRIMVESIAGMRGTSIPRLLEAADGKIYVGQAAVDVGLVDGIMSLDQVIQRVERGKGIKPVKTANFESHVFDLCQAGRPQQEAFRAIKETHPGLFADFERRLKVGQVDELFPGQNRGQRL